MATDHALAQNGASVTKLGDPSWARGSADGAGYEGCRWCGLAVTRGSGTSFRDGLTWADAVSGNGPGNDHRFRDDRKQVIKSRGHTVRNRFFVAARVCEHVFLPLTVGRA